MNDETPKSSPKSALARRRLAGTTACSRCGAAMECGAVAGAAHCWCMDLPPLALSQTLDVTQSCLCRACLTALVEKP